MKNLQILNWSQLNTLQRKSVLSRPFSDTPQNQERLSKQVSEILSKVREKGDVALYELTRQFDRVELSSLAVSENEVREAYGRVPATVQKALKEAIRRVSVFHRAQLPKPIELETGLGVRCEQRFLPIDPVGLYIPAGTAPLASAVIMMGVPSLIAGCKKRVIVSPPNSDPQSPSFGKIDPTILVAADMVGIEEIYSIGGAQAIAALSYGTNSIPKVNKIFGPGNRWVTEAKAQVSKEPGGPASDMPAGPSEVMVIADSTGVPEFIAADLLAQAEHGSDSQVVFISTSTRMLEEVKAQVKIQLEKLPRQKTAAMALENSRMIEVSTLETALEIANEYAPEHLILQVENARNLSYSVRNAGSVFIGNWSPESMGDYASGTNHVLPTFGYAKSYSGLSTTSFMKSMTVQELTLSGLRDLGPTVETLADTEGLFGHRNAVTLRLRRGIQ